ncbi:MAG: ATP-binding cassette domain-containing protein, partial [Pyrinomonadaceae bacterium]
GYVIQEGGLFPHFNIERNVVLVPSLEGGQEGGGEDWNKEKLHERAHEMLNLVGLDPAKFATRFPHELSGGQRQRVGVARALAADPPLLLLDEPFGALDPITRHQLQKEFLALVRRLSKTTIFVTHDVHEALVVGSRIGLMREGALVMLLTPDEFTQSDDKTIRTYMDSLKVN